MSREIEKTPRSLVKDGRIIYGTFDRPVPDPRLLEADLLWKGAPRAFRNFRLKEWLGVGLDHENWYFSTIIADSKYLSNATFYAYDKKNGLYYEWQAARPPLTGGIRVANACYNDVCYFRSSKYNSTFTTCLDQGRIFIKVKAEKGIGGKNVETDLTLYEDFSASPPLSASVPLEPKHYMYTHKAVAPISGIIKIGREEIVFNPSRDAANIDEHKAFYPYNTTWKWAAFGKNENGKLLGVNVCDHKTTYPETYNQNCAWYGDKIELLADGRIERDLSDPLKPWKVEDTDGRTNLVFHPRSAKKQKNNFGLISIDYCQAIGTFDGIMIDAYGKRHFVNDFWGVCEYMDARF